MHGNPSQRQSHGHTHSYVSQVISMQSKRGGEIRRETLGQEWGQTGVEAKHYCGEAFLSLQVRAHQSGRR